MSENGVNRFKIIPSMGRSFWHFLTIPGAVSAKDTIASNPSCLQLSIRSVLDSTCNISNGSVKHLLTQMMNQWLSTKTAMLLFFPTISSGLILLRDNPWQTYKASLILPLFAQLIKTFQSLRQLPPSPYKCHQRNSAENYVHTIYSIALFWHLPSYKMWAHSLLVDGQTWEHFLPARLDILTDCHPPAD